jgi:MFS family permease
MPSAPEATPEAPAAATVPIGRLRRDFRLLLAGSSVSMLGSRVSAIAYPLLALTLTRSPLAAGWTCFAATAPSVVFYIPAGALIDRWDARRAMLTCEFLRGVAIGCLVVLLVSQHLTVTLLIELAVVEEILEVFSHLAERRIVRSLVDPGKAATALAQNEARTHAVVMLGRPVGAALFGAEPFLPFLLDAATFVVSTATLVPIRYRKSEYAELAAATPNLSQEIREGFHWLRADHFFFRSIFRTAGTTLIFQALVIIFLGEASQQHLAKFAIGAILAASGLGGVFGSMLTTFLSRKFKPKTLFDMQLSIWALTFLALALSGGTPVIFLAIGMIVLGFTGAIGNIALDSYIVETVPENILARVLSVERLTSFAALAIGALLGGFLFNEAAAQFGIASLFIFNVLLLRPRATRDAIRDWFRPKTPADRESS